MNFLIFLETLIFILAGQYIHVLIKLRNAQRQFESKFEVGIFFRENRFNLILNGSLIIILAYMLGRVGFGAALDQLALTWKPADIFGLVIPATLWLPLLEYAAYLAAGYAIQSIFYWLLKGGLKKVGIEVVKDEKDHEETL
jgi:hypothetical protein